jgi:hypothetical protein
MTRKGKIARLPHEIRGKLNQRLQDGEPGNRLVVWLNSLPKVREALKEEFGARPITEQNLSEWKLGGYVDWERHEGSCELVKRLTDEAGDLKVAAGDGVVSDRLATVVAAELAGLIRIMLAETTDPKERWQRLKEMLPELARLRKEDHKAAGLLMEAERWEIERDRLEEEDWQRDLEAAKDRARAPLYAAMKVNAVAEGFGGGRAAIETAAWLMELAYDLKPGSLSPQIAPGQAGSEQHSTGANGKTSGKAPAGQTEPKPGKSDPAPVTQIKSNPTKSDQIRPNRTKSTKMEPKQTQANPIRPTECPPPEKNGS